MAKKATIAAALEERAMRFNAEIGKLLRARRNELGMTQSEIATQLGVSQQQIVKYEKSGGRIPADSLLSLCGILGLDPGSVFVPLQIASGTAGFSEEKTTPFEVEAFADRDIVALVRAFQRIADKTVRRKALAVIEALAESDVAPPTAPNRKKRRR